MVVVGAHQGHTAVQAEGLEERGVALAGCGRAGQGPGGVRQYQGTWHQAAGGLATPAHRVLDNL